MKSVLLDSSTTLSRFLPDEDSTLIDAVLAEAITGEVEFIAAPHWRLECWSGLLAAERRGRIESNSADASRTELALLPVMRLPDHPPVDTIFELARRHRLSIYDAAHLALALQEGALLATGDRALAKAADSHQALWK